LGCRYEFYLRSYPFEGEKHALSTGGSKEENMVSKISCKDNS
jgi:hypothetical protein